MSGVFLSEDQVESWKARGLTSIPITGIAVDKKNPKTIYVTAASLCFQILEINQGWDKPFVHTLEFDPLNPDKIYAGTTEGFYSYTRVTGVAEGK